MTEVYFLLSFLISGLIYPIVIAWVNDDGWLNRLGFSESGLGSAVLLVGGTSGFVGNLMLGPRYGIFFQQKATSEKKRSKSGFYQRFEQKNSYNRFSNSSPDNSKSLLSASTNPKKTDRGEEKNLIGTPKLSFASIGVEEQKEIFPLPKPYLDRNRPETSFLGFISQEINKLEVSETKRRASMNSPDQHEINLQHSDEI